MKKNFGLDCDGRSLYTGDRFHRVYERSFCRGSAFGVVDQHSASGLFLDSEGRFHLYRQVRRIDVDLSECGMSFAELMVCAGHSEYTGQ